MLLNKLNIFVNKNLKKTNLAIFFNSKNYFNLSKFEVILNSLLILIVKKINLPLTITRYPSFSIKEFKSLLKDLGSYNLYKNELLDVTRFFIEWIYIEKSIQDELNHYSNLLTWTKKEQKKLIILISLFLVIYSRWVNIPVLMYSPFITIFFFVIIGVLDWVINN